MNDSSGAVTFSEAARLMGWRSRSQLYRLRDAGALQDYLREGDKGAMVLALEPPGLPTLEEHLGQLIRTQVNSPGRPPKQPPPDPVQVAQREVSQLQRELAKAKAREKEWITHYSELHRWVIEDAAHDLHGRFRDLERVGDVMVWLRQELVQRIKPLDACELESRFPR